VDGAGEDGDAYTMSWVKRPTRYIFSMHTKLQKGRMICASADIFVVASPSFLGAPIFPFLVGYWSAPFLFEFKK
jgi:hypothetical protein